MCELWDALPVLARGLVVVRRHVGSATRQLDHGCPAGPGRAAGQARPGGDDEERRARRPHAAAAHLGRRTWIFLDAKTGANQPGKFTDAQISTIANLLADPALLVESKMPSNPVACADTIVYTVQTLEAQFRYDQCSAAGKRPATERLINAILDATPL